LEALESENFDRLAEIWSKAGLDSDLAHALRQLHDGLVEELQLGEEVARASHAFAAAVTKHLPNTEMDSTVAAQSHRGHPLQLQGPFAEVDPAASAKGSSMIPPAPPPIETVSRLLASNGGLTLCYNPPADPGTDGLFESPPAGLHPELADYL